MRILTVGSMYPPHHLGGYELVWQSAVRFLRGRGHEVCVLASDYRRGDLPEEDPGVRRELRSYWREHEFPRLRLTQRLSLERHNAQVLDLVMDRLDPDVVLWWAMGGLSMSLIEHVRRRGTPAAGVICEDWLLSGPILDGWQSLFAGRRRRLAPLGERLTGVPCRVDLAAVGPSLFPSESIRRRTRTRGVPLPRTEVVNQGVDPAVFPPAPPRTWRWRLLYVGRLDPRKGIDIALRAMALLPDAAELQVLGAGDESHLEELRMIAAESGCAERVTFSEVPRERLAAVYADADAVVFPVRWEEPWGLVPLEAMSVGRPVVATGRGGSGEYLRDGVNCLLFDPDAGPEGLAEALGRLAADEGLRERLRTGGVETTGQLPPDAFDRAVERLALDAAGRTGDDDHG